jgi:hypothetical protein
MSEDLIRSLSSPVNGDDELLCELCGPLQALRKRNPLEKERYVGAKLAKHRKARKADVNP